MEIVFEHGDSAAQRELARCLVQLGVARMAEQVSDDGEYGRRQAAMALFVEMAGRGLLTCTRQRLIAWLARHTNLGSESAVKQLFYRCQRMQYGR